MLFTSVQDTSQPTATAQDATPTATHTPFPINADGIPGVFGAPMLSNTTPVLLGALQDIESGEALSFANTYIITNFSLGRSDNGLFFVSVHDEQGNFIDRFQGTELSFILAGCNCTHRNQR